MTNYVHIMPIGKNLGHVDSVLKDIKLRPIKRIHLIHSPDDPATAKAPFPFEKTAKQLKKKIERDYRGLKVILTKLTSNGAFDKLETQIVIGGIVNDELARKDSKGQKVIVTPTQIALNIAGGTNMQVAGGIIAAANKKITAYYVLNDNFEQNQNLESLVQEIEVPRVQTSKNRVALQKILYTISKNEFSWNGITEEKKFNPRQPKTHGVHIDNSISETRWISPQNISGIIAQKDLKIPGVTDTTLRRNLKILKGQKFIEINGVPKLSTAKPSASTPIDTYTIDEKENLIEITQKGLVELQDYTP